MTDQEVIDKIDDAIKVLSEVSSEVWYVKEALTNYNLELRAEDARVSLSLAEYDLADIKRYLLTGHW